MCLIDMIERVAEIPVSKPVRHTEILIQVIAAVPGCSTGNLTAVVTNKLKHPGDDIDHITGLQISGQNKIETGTTAHRTKIDVAVLPFRIISQEGCTEMLDGMNLGSIHDRFTVRCGHAEVKSGDDLLSDVILARYIDARLQEKMIDSKAGYFFHEIPLYLVRILDNISSW